MSWALRSACATAQCTQQRGRLRGPLTSEQLSHGDHLHFRNAWPFTGSTYVPVNDRVENPARRLGLADVTAEGCPEDRDHQGGRPTQPLWTCTSW